MLCGKWTVPVVLVSLLVLQQRGGRAQDEDTRQNSQVQEAMEVPPVPSREIERTPALEMYSSAVYALETKYPDTQQLVRKWPPLSRIKSLVDQIQGSRDATRKDSTAQLFRAIARRDTEGLRKLIKSDPKLPQHLYMDELSAYQAAAFLDCSEEARVLLEHQVELNGVDHLFSPIVIATMLKHSETLAAFLQYPHHFSDEFFKDLLKSLTKLNDIPRTNLVLKYLHPHVVDRESLRTLTHVAVGYESWDVLDTLSGTLLDAKRGVGDDKQSLLVEASRYNYSVRIYIDHGLVDNATMEEGEVALHWAAHNCHLDNARHLTELGMMLDLHGRSLISAAYCNNSDIFKELALSGNLYEYTQDFSELLVEAVKDENDLAVARLLKVSLFPPKKDQKGDSLLHLAASIANSRILAYLLEAGMDTEIANEEGTRPLHIAVLNKQISTTNILLAKGANPGVEDNFGNTPLHTAVDVQFADIIPVLRYYGANPNKTKADGRAPVHLAAEHDHCQSIQNLAKIGANLDAHRADSFCPLHDAVVKGSTQTVNCLVRSGANVNALVSWGANAAHLAVLHGHTDVVRQLIKHKVNVTHQDENSFTPLHVAAEHSRVESAKVLLNNGVSADITGSAGRTPLHIAAEKGDERLVRLLSDHGGDVRKQSEWGASLLHFAAINGHVQMVSTLVTEYRLDVDSVDLSGVTPLISGAENLRLGACRELLRLGADADAKSKKLRTAAHVAVEKGNAELLEMLHHSGAELDLCATQEYTPWRKILFLLLKWAGLAEYCEPLLHTATNAGQTEMVTLLLHYGVDVNSMDISGATALHAALQRQDITTVCALLFAGADVHIEKNNLISPLVIAVATNNIETTKELIRWGAEPKEDCWLCMRPLDYAKSQEMVEVIKYWRSIAHTRKTCVKVEKSAEEA
eukprot:gb/GECG01013504.1/.p1 GENE.gb/GECG01013504.1/~~gb/GECG01013504.1/.p1  ORF type:complete len:917 (+),score=114.37 gb/GECG01013504.1/:1-2751(+)